MAQLTYSQTSDAAFAGMLDGLVPHIIRSYAAESAVGIGAPVRLGTNPEKEVLPATTGANTIGFAIHDHARTQSSAGVVNFAATETVNVLVSGRFWVETNDAVVAGAVANLVTANGKLTDAAVTTGIEAFTQVSVRFLTSTTGPGLALVAVK